MTTFNDFPSCSSSVCKTCKCDPTTNPNNHSRSEPNMGYQNYSAYECRPTPPSSNEFWVVGDRRPTCRVGGCPDLDYWASHGIRATDVDDMRANFPGYWRNAKLTNIKKFVW